MKQVKVVFLGTDGSKKNKLITKIRDQEEVSVDFATYTAEHIKYQLWNTSEQERFANVYERYMLKSNIAVLCFSAANRESFAKLNRFYEMVKKLSPKARILLVCTDREEIGQGNNVTLDQIYAFMGSKKDTYCISCSVTDNDVKDFTYAMSKIGKEIVSTKSQDSIQDTFAIDATQRQSSQGLASALKSTVNGVFSSLTGNGKLAPAAAQHGIFPSANCVDRKPRQEGLIKVTFLGAPGSQKEQLISQISGQKSNLDFAMYTAGVIEYQLFNTPGQERFADIDAKLTIGSNIAVLCFSAANKESFAKLNQFYAMVKEQSPDAHIFLVCTDQKAIGHGDNVTLEQIGDFVKGKFIQYMPCNVGEGNVADLKSNMSEIGQGMVAAQQEAAEQQAAQPDLQH